MQGAKCYIILAPAFQRLYERKIGTLKTGRLIEGGRLVQGRSQGRVYISYVSKTLIFHSMHAQARQLLLLSTQANISFRLRFLNKYRTHSDHTPVSYIPASAR